jgi:hypothetical protein
VATVIVHPEDGLFLGVGLGFAFWSNLDCGGQSRACTFRDAAEARKFAATSLGYEQEGLTFVNIPTSLDYADVTVLKAAGLGHLVGPLELEMLENAAPSACGRA